MKPSEYSRILLKFSERLKELMETHDIRSELLGKKVGLSGETIRRYCKAKGGANLGALVNLADYFSCSIEFLIGRTNTVLDFTLHEAENFPNSLRNAMHEKGYSRYSMDKQTNFKDGYFSNWDTGSAANMFTLIELSDLLGCTIDYLVGREK